MKLLIIKNKERLIYKSYNNVKITIILNYKIIIFYEIR